MRGFPKAIASALGWTEPEVTVALVQLVSQLEGVVDNAYLHPPERQQRVYGSFNPMEYKLGGAKGH